MVDFLPARLLRAHVPRCADDRPVQSGGSSCGCWRNIQSRTPVRDHLGNAEVEQLHDAAGCDLDVARLEIAMGDAFRMRGLERACDLAGVFERLAEWQTW